MVVLFLPLQAYTFHPFPNSEPPSSSEPPPRASFSAQRAAWRCKAGGVGGTPARFFLLLLPLFSTLSLFIIFKKTHYVHSWRRVRPRRIQGTYKLVRSAKRSRRKWAL